MQGNTFGFDPNFAPYQQRQPRQLNPAVGNMQQYSPTPQQTPGDQNPLDGGYTPQAAPANVGAPDYLSFLSKMAGKKAF